MSMLQWLSVTKTRSGNQPQPLLEESPSPSTSSASPAFPDTTASEVQPKKRAKVLNKEWLAEFGWSECVEGKLFCRTCRTVARCNNAIGRRLQKNAFVTGSSNLQKSALTRHEASGDHKTAVLAGVHRQQMEEVQATTSEAATDSLTAQMRTAIMMAEQDIPDTKFLPLLELQKANGASALQDQVSWYKGHRTVQELQACGAKVCQERIRQRLKESQFVGIMLDESLDICVQKKLVIVCKLVIDGKPLLQFGTNIEVQNGKADTIVTALRTFLDEMKIPVGKVVGLGTDGASVMLGCKNGVVTVFKRLNPSLISVWCCAHRLSLACHWAGQRVPALQKLQETLVRLYKYFKYSAVRTNELKQLKNLMQEKVRKLKKPTAVRWLSLQDAVVAAQESWGCLVLMLEHEVASNEGDTALSTSLLKDIKTYKFIALLCMLRDALEPLTACSKSFQKDIIDVEETNTLLQATLDNVTSLAEYPGPHVAKLHASLEGEGKYQTIAFRATLHQKEETSNTCRNFVNALDAGCKKVS